MRKRVKKCVGNILVCILATGCITGCGGNTTTSTTRKNAPADEEKKVEQFSSVDPESEIKKMRQGIKSKLLPSMHTI